MKKTIACISQHLKATRLRVDGTRYLEWWHTEAGTLAREMVRWGGN